MKIRHGLITISFYFIAFSPSATLAYGPDLLSEPLFYCPGYANCTSRDCIYNRMASTQSSNSFNKTEKVTMSCDSLVVEFTFPDSTDETFVGNESLTCRRYYDGVSHHFVLAKITLNKPKDVNASQVNCTSSMGDCTLLNETPSEMIFVTGLPSTCITETKEFELMLPSKAENFECLNYKHCIGNQCHFHRMSSEANTRPFLENADTIIRCNDLKVDILYPHTNDTTFSGIESYTCFQYANDDGTSFSVVEIGFNKPKDVDGTQLSCSVEPAGNWCTKNMETPSQITFVAGLPDICFPYNPPTPVPAQDQIVDCPQYLNNCDNNICHFKGTYIDKASTHFITGDGSWFTCRSLTVDILVPTTTGSVYVGNKTYSCFLYNNGNGTTFPVAEVNLTMPDGVSGSDVSCMFDGKDCTLQNETANQITLVAGFPRTCTPWEPSVSDTTTAASTTAVETTTTVATTATGTNQTTVTSSDEPTTTVTAGTNSTNGTTVSPTEASSSTASSSSTGETTTAGSTPGSTDAGPATTGKGKNSTAAVARLEFAAVIVMTGAPFIRQYL